MSASRNSALKSAPTTSASAAEQLGASQPAYDAGLLLVRLAVGLTVAAHGAQKLFGWFSGPGLDATGKSFTLLGYPSGKTMAVVDGLSELLGGLGLALGLLTPLAGAAVLGVMINAVSVKWNGGFFIPTGVEYEVVLAVTGAALAVAGPGRVAMDRYLPVVRTHRLSYGISAVALGAIVALIILIVRN